MNRLRKLVELSHDKRTGRIVYVLRPDTLPAAQSEHEWVEDSSFNAAEAVLADASLKEVFKAAIANGYALVDRSAIFQPKPRQMQPSVFTVEIDKKPIVSFEAKNTKEATELTKEDWFLADLQILTSKGQVLWDGKAPIRVRLATEPEAERYRDIAAEAEDEGGDIVLAFLVTLDNAPR